MDPLRYKRPATQTSGQITETNLRNPQPVPKVLLTRPSRPLRSANNGGLPVRRRINNMDGFRAPGTRMAPIIQPAAAPNAIPAQQSPSLSRLASVAVAQHQATPQPITPVQQTAAAARIPMDMSLPGEDSPSRFQEILFNSKWRGARQWAFRGVALAMVLVITMGGLLFSTSYLKLHKVFKGGTETAEALKTNVNPDLLKGEGSGRVNILLLGRGGGAHQAPDLTDTLMIASIDPVNHTTTLVSLPRDLWVNVPDHGVMKLNAVWQTGVFNYLGKKSTGSTNPKAIAEGFKLVDQTVQDILGIEINYNTIVDFQAFKQAVDTVNGVTIDVPTDLVDPTMAWETANNPVLAKAGIQTFDGTHALIYSRSRETTSDFARAGRQRAMLVALKTKVVELGTLSNPIKISKLMSAFGNNVQTDLSLKNASRLFSIIKAVPDTSTNSIGLADGANKLVTTGNITGQSVVIPKSGLYKYEEIQQYMRTQLKDPYMIKENAKILILNGTLISGQATVKAAELTKYGYNVVGTGNTPTGGWTNTTLVDLSGGKKKYTRHYLEGRTGVSAINSLSDKTIATNGADFVIIIGSDEANPN